LKNYKLTHEASQNFLDKLIKYDWYILKNW
jgi:hypothetical protein